jgi:hypothetical protein
LKHWKLDRILWADALDEWYKFDAIGRHAAALGSEHRHFLGPAIDARIAYASPRLAAKWIEEDPWHAEQEF